MVNSVPALSSDYESLQFDNAGRRDQIANMVRESGWKAFERPLPETIVAVTARWPGLFIDVGCNTGFYMLLAARSHPRNHVLAFEPVKGIRKIARRNADLNDVSSRVDIRGQAVSDRNGSANLYIPPDDHGLVETSASLDRDFKPSHMRQDTVPVRRLDRALLSSRYRWKKVSVIKIDVEGHEAAVLDGAFWVTRLYRPIVFLEVLERANVIWLNDYVRKNRYLAYKLEPENRAVREPEIGFDRDAWNHALVPIEKASSFESLL